VHASARNSLQRDAYDVSMHNAAMAKDSVLPGFPAVAATGKIKLKQGTVVDAGGGRW
jgi:hypothetical protein